MDTSGQLGINKVSPATALDVNGTITATLFSCDLSNNSGVVVKGISATYH